MFTSAQSRLLKELVNRYKARVEPPRSWKQRTPDELWRRVLAQIIVVGNAAPGYLLERSGGAKEAVAVRRLNRYGRNRPRLQKHLHHVLRILGTRYVGKDWRRDRKSQAAAENYLILRNIGGPKRFFAGVASLGDQEKRLRFLASRLKYYGSKGARDTLIELKLATDCMALDSRIVRLVTEVGVRLPRALGKDYDNIERALILEIARPCGLTGAQLDRVLFQNYDAILTDLKLGVGTPT